MPYQTLFYGLFDRALSFGQRPPYNLSPRLAQARAAIELATPLNFVYTGDTIGGNSGSPVVDRNGDVVGLNFDSNLEKLPNRYYYVADDRYSVLGGPREPPAAAKGDEEFALQGGPTLPDPARQRVRKTRWRTVHGQRADGHHGLLVCASQGLQGAQAERLTSYDLRRLVPYADGYLAGFAAEAYAVELSAGHVRARARMDALQKELCASAVEGDTHRNLLVRNRYSDETFRYALLPVWIATYRYRARLYRFVVSGQTGEVIGQAPYSRLKVALACLLGLAALLLVLYLWDRH